MSLLPWLLVGGAGGALSRFLLIEFCLRFLGWPAWGTLIAINALGSLAIGVAAAEIADPTSAWVTHTLQWAAIDPDGARTRLSGLLLTGVLGGLTTFSSYQLDAFVLLRTRRYRAFAFHFAGTPLLAFAAAALGWWLASGEVM